MKKIKVGLLVGEFFTNDIPIYACKGGYGMLARNYICKYIPSDNIQIDVIIGENNHPYMRIEKIDDTNLLYLPGSKSGLYHKIVGRISGQKRESILSIVDQYDVFISIEFTNVTRFVMEYASRNQKLILWIQDPRPQSDWDELLSVSLVKQNGYRPNKKTSSLVNKLYNENRIVPITQGKCLVQKAIDLYDLPKEFMAKFVPNPIVIPQLDENEISCKQNKIVSLGRLDSVKRPWIIAEVAKRMPQYDFYFCGQIHEKKMHEIMKPYLGLKNCHFAGHIEGNEKANLLRDSKILINSSIHEAIPISFLEAMSYGMLLVSNRNPDDLTSQFGIGVKQINGDGYDSVDSFVEAIENIMLHPEIYVQKALEARAYIQSHHSIDKFIGELRSLIESSVKQ